MLKMRVDVTDVELPESLAPTDFIVRDADISDASEASAVTDLHNACFHRKLGIFTEYCGRKSLIGPAADADRNGFAPIVVLSDASNGELVGYNWITLSDGDGRVSRWSVFTRVCVERRLGWTIFNAGVEKLITHGATALVLDVDSENPPARRIYESAGYRTYSKVKYYGLEVVTN